MPKSGWPWKWRSTKTRNAGHWPANCRVLEWIWRHEAMLADLADSLGTPTGLDEQVKALRRPG